MCLSIAITTADCRLIAPVARVTGRTAVRPSGSTMTKCVTAVCRKVVPFVVGAMLESPIRVALTTSFREGATLLGDSRIAPTNWAMLLQTALRLEIGEDF